MDGPFLIQNETKRIELLPHSESVVTKTSTTRNGMCLLEETVKGRAETSHPFTFNVSPYFLEF